MKSILVIEETPVSCCCCPCGRYDSTNDTYYCGSNHKHLFIDDFYNKVLKKCPLKPLPGEEEMSNALFEAKFEQRYALKYIEKFINSIYSKRL